MNLTVHVTQDDINSGERGMCSECPVAIALERTLNDTIGGEWGVAVERDCAAIGHIASATSDWLAKDLLVPESVSEFVGAYDDCLPVSPFTFTLDIPDDLLGGVA